MFGNRLAAGLITLLYGLELSDLGHFRDTRADLLRSIALEGIEYIVYVEKPGPVELQVDDHGYDVAWINPTTGDRVKAKGYKGKRFTGTGAKYASISWRTCSWDMCHSLNQLSVTSAGNTRFTMTESTVSP